MINVESSYKQKEWNNHVMIFLLCQETESFCKWGKPQ